MFLRFSIFGQKSEKGEHVNFDNPQRENLFLGCRAAQNCSKTVSFSGVASDDDFGMVFEVSGLHFGFILGAKTPPTTKPEKECFFLAFLINEAGWMGWGMGQWYFLSFTEEGDYHLRQEGYRFNTNWRNI